MANGLSEQARLDAIYYVSVAMAQVRDDRNHTGTYRQLRDALKTMKATDSEIQRAFAGDPVSVELIRAVNGVRGRK